MTNRTYRLLFGAILLIALYLNQINIIYALIGIAIFEAVTNLRIPKLVSRLRGRSEGDPNEGCIGIAFEAWTSFEAERAWRLSVSAFLILSVFIYPELLWFFPWFMGFAILGSGVSGVCPMYLALRWAGLK